MSRIFFWQVECFFKVLCFPQRTNNKWAETVATSTQVAATLDARKVNATAQEANTFEAAKLDEVLMQAITDYVKN